MTRGEDFIKKGKCKNNHCSPMSNAAWCGLNSKCDILKLPYLCHNPKCKCQKQINFNPNQFQLEGAGFENTMKNCLKALKKCVIISLSLD